MSPARRLDPQGGPDPGEARPGEPPALRGPAPAVAALVALLDEGADTSRAAARVLDPLAAEAGRRWAAGSWSPWREGVASQVVEAVAGAVATRPGAPPADEGVPVVVAGGEWHLLPARLAALALRLAGCDGVLLGPLPLHQVEQAITGDRACRALVVSCAVAGRLPGVGRRVAAAHRAGLPVLAVGPGFGPDGAWARRLGADAWAPGTALGGLADLPPGPPFVAPVAPDPEADELRRLRAQIVDAALGQLLVTRYRDLAARFGSEPLDQRRVLEGLARCLEASLVVDDAAVLLDHVRRLVATAGARGRSPELVPAAVGCLATAVHTPRAARLMAQASVRAAECLADAQRAGEVATRAHAAAEPALHAPVRADDALRHSTLTRLRIMDSPAEADFSDVVGLAATVCSTPVAGLAFVEADRVWLKARLGPTPAEEHRSTSPAAWAVSQRDLLVVPDLAADRRFSAHPAVRGEPGLRFWAGVPVVTGDDVALGALFVADTATRTLSGPQHDALLALARQAAALLELRARHFDVDLAGAPFVHPDGDHGGERARLVRQLLGDTVGSDRLLRTREVALLFDVSERTVNYWASQGRLPSRQTAGGHRRYAARDVLELFQTSSQQLAQDG